jgi:hypothetical protein
VPVLSSTISGKGKGSVYGTGSVSGSQPVRANEVIIRKQCKIEQHDFEKCIVSNISNNIWQVSRHNFHSRNQPAFIFFGNFISNPTMKE